MSSKIVSRTRRNHALEHATINVLTQRHKNFSAQGNSAPWGFYLNIYGDIGEESVAQAVEEAFGRLHKGESKLALHPGCGTVRLTTATMAVLAAQGAFSLERRRQRKSATTLSVLFGALPAAVIAVTLALIAAQPLGMAVQANITVEPDLGNLRVTSIRKISPSPITRLFQYLLGQAGNKHVHAFKIQTVDDEIAAIE